MGLWAALSERTVSDLGNTWLSAYTIPYLVDMTIDLVSL